MTTTAEHQRPTVPASLLVAQPSDPPWLKLLLASLHEDTREVKGEGINPYIAGCYQTLGLDPTKHQDDTSPWCAIAACANIKRSGFKPWGRVFAARGMLAWGLPRMTLERGVWVCLDRIDPKEPTVQHGHATCCLGLSETPGWFYGCGGNQHNEMSADAFEIGRVAGIRIPLTKL